MINPKMEASPVPDKAVPDKAATKITRTQTQEVGGDPDTARTRLPAVVITIISGGLLLGSVYSP